MRPPRVLAIAAVLPLLLHAGTVTAAIGELCEPAGADATAVTRARADIAATCNCAGATSHGDYVACARKVLQARVFAHKLSVECSRVVRRCASHSICGSPNAVTCCRTSAKGTTRCHVKRDASRCTMPPGGSACVGVYQSCCDACTSMGCAPPPTPSPTPTPG